MSYLLSVKIIECKTTQIKSYTYFFWRNYAVLNIMADTVYSAIIGNSNLGKLS